MRNLKIYKRVLPILTISTIVLMCGCSKTKTEQTRKGKQENECKHLTIYFEDQPITFKECEGYFIYTCVDANEGNLDYSIRKDDKKIITHGETNQYNCYEVYHDIADEIIDNESVQKVK